MPSLLLAKISRISRHLSFHFVTSAKHGKGPASAVRETGSVERLSEEEEARKKIEAKEKAAKAKKRAQGRGIEGKYVYSLHRVGKYRENEALFDNVSLTLLQGYVASSQKAELMPGLSSSISDL